MTQDELERLEARVQSAAGWMQVGKQMPWDGFTEARALAVEQNLALIAEVRRLRGLVEAAYHEALSYAGEGWCTDDTKNAWLHADARKALEAA